MSDIIHLEPDVDGFGVGKEDGRIVIDFTDGQESPAYPVKIYLEIDAAQVMVDLLRMVINYPYDDMREQPQP